jgi:hypothetical protein
MQISTKNNDAFFAPGGFQPQSFPEEFFVGFSGGKTTA